jgi:hypothetical protein
MSAIGDNGLDGGEAEGEAPAEPSAEELEVRRLMMAVISYII